MVLGLFESTWRSEKRRPHILREEEEERRIEVFVELQQADLITIVECLWLSDISDVVKVQRVKSPEVMAKTADVLRRHGFVSESKLLAVKAVLAELRQADLITSEECETLEDHRWRWDGPSDVVEIQCVKSPEVMAKTADVLRRHGFESESKLLAVKVVLAELRQADLITSEECRRLKDTENDYTRLYYPLYTREFNISDVVRVQCFKSPEVMGATADVLRRHGFESESKLLAVLAELRQADLITSEECEGLTCPSDVIKVQCAKSLEVLLKTADLLRRHGFEQVPEPADHHDKAEVRHLVGEEWSGFLSDYCKLKRSVHVAVECLPKRLRRLFRHECKELFHSARRLSRSPRASNILDIRDLRQQIQALRDPELLRQLSSYEEGSLKPFIVTFLERCKENGVQPDSSQPDVPLSPSTPADQLLGFILSRKDYYITDLHINRKHFSPWDVDTHPPATAPPTLNGLSRHLDSLLTSYSTLFTKVVENVETLPQRQYRNLRSYFNGLPHLEVHLPSSQDEVCDHLHRTPLFAPLCTALLRKVVKFLFTDDADNLSHQLEDYEKKLFTFVRQFLLACHREGVVPSTGGTSLDEDGCDLSDPSHLLTCVLALKAYYVVSLCVDESLFTSLQREVDLEGEGREENVSMDASPLSPTPPTSESEIPGTSIPSQSKGKGKYRVSTSPSVVPAKRSGQGEDSEEEEEEEVTAGSAAKKRREGSHMTSHMTEIMKTYQDDFLKYMKAEALCVTLALKGVIPEEVETDITRARSTSKANQILYRHLQEQGTEANLRQLCEVASMEKGYGKMNELAGRILEEL